MRVALLALLGALAANACAAQDVAPQQAVEATTFQPSEEPTPGPTSPTQKPTTAKPTMAPIPASGKPTVVVSVDEAFMDFYEDPFYGSDIVGVPLPPAVIAERGIVTDLWKRGQILVPAHLDYFAFNLWHGDNADAIVPYTESDFQVNVRILGKSVKDVKLIFKEEGSITAGVEAQIICSGELSDKEEEGRIIFNLRRIGYPNTEFSVTKKCERMHHEELLVSSQTGDLLFSGGEVNPAYNLHDVRTPSFIASKEDQSDTLYFHTLSEQYKIVGRPDVRAFEPNEEMLKWIAERNPDLLKATEEAAKESDEDKAADAFFNENKDAGDAYGDDVDQSDATVVETTQVENTVKVPTFIQRERESKMVRERSQVCDPTLGGELAHRPNLRISHRKDIGENALMGFAQAGMLGMHGARRLAVNYNCMQDGLAFILVHATVQSLDSNSDALRRETVRFSYLKVCSAGQIAPGLIDLMGFDVHVGVFTPDEPAFYPVINGLTTEQFSYDGLDIVAASDESHTSFYASLRPAVADLRSEQNLEQRLRILRVRIANRYNTLDTMRPKLSGHGAHGGIVDAEALPITVHYHCQKSGTVRTGIDLLVDVVQGKDANGDLKTVGDGTVRRISFYWKKECVVTPLTSFGVRTASPELFKADEADRASGVSDVSHAGDKKAFQAFKPQLVVERGLVLPAFDSNSAKPSKRNVHKSSTLASDDEEQGDRFSVEADQGVLALELYKHAPSVSPEPGVHLNPHRAPPRAGLRFRSPKLVSSSPNVRVSLRSIGEMERLANLGRKEFVREEGAKALTFKEKKMARLHSFDVAKDPIDYEISVDNKVYLVIDHVCLSSGSAEITLELPVHAAREQTVFLTWTKQCDWSTSQVSAKQTGGAVIFFVALAVGLTGAAFAVFIKKQRAQIHYLEANVDTDDFATNKVQDSSSSM